MSIWKLRPYERHSLVLLMAGLSFVAMGVSMFFYIPNGPRMRSLALVLEYAPIEFWAIVFIIAGVMVVLSSRWPENAVSWGYAVLTGLSCGWSAVYLLSWALADSPPVNLTYSIYWALLAFLWWAISGLLNPTKKEERHGADKEGQN